MFIPFLFLAIVGIGLFSFSLIIHPNIVDAAMSGSLFFSIIGGIFIFTGIIGLFVFYIKKYKEWKFDKNGVSIYGYVADVDPLIKNSNGKLCGYNVEFYVYEQDDTVSKEYQQYKLPFEINFGLNYFPKKEFKGITYDEGYYESVVVTLGEGLGDNWWCVLFPPLCMLEAEESTEVEYTTIKYYKN